MRTAILVCLALAVPALTLPSRQEVDEPKDPKQLIESQGYKAQEYTVETEDGHILKLYRIPRGKNEKPTEGNGPRPVVFLQHGLGTSAADWVLNTPEKSAGFVFADAGFDVWLGNFRGSKYARQHKHYGPEVQQFWQFSWYELATQDLPSMINKILDETKVQKIYYVAHSLGATAALALFSSKPTIANKIKQFHAIAPIHMLENVQGVLKYTKSFFKDANFISTMFSSGEFPGEYTPNMRLQEAWSRYICKDPANDLVCKNVLLMISGPNTRQINPDLIESINAHGLNGISIQTLVHLGQMFEFGQQFRAYDYGNPALNREHYKSETPPMFNIAQIQPTTTVFLYSSECDWLAEPLDVKNTATRLAAVLASNLVVPSFNHMDFIWGDRAAAEIYKPIVASIGMDFTPKQSP